VHGSKIWWAQGSRLTVFWAVEQDEKFPHRTVVLRLDLEIAHHTAHRWRDQPCVVTYLGRGSRRSWIARVAVGEVGKGVELKVLGVGSKSVGCRVEGGGWCRVQGHGVIQLQIIIFHTPAVQDLSAEDCQSRSQGS
jgi:hypothetical protein